VNKRIKEVRKYYKLSQEKFGEKLGVTKTAVSKMELGTYNVTDTMTKLICSEYNISREWLETGNGEMFVQSETFSLDEYAHNKNLSSLELDIIKGYMELDHELRNALMSHFKSIFDRHSEITATKEDSPSKKDKPIQHEDSIERELNSYRLELEAEKKGTISSVSANTSESLIRKEG
jgi:transcriptional regulator with XRE-family HTH domain